MLDAISASVLVRAAQIGWNAELLLVLVDVGDLHRNGRSSSAEKRADADFRIAFARRSSLTSRSSSATRAASVLVVPGRLLSSVSACLTQLRQGVGMNVEPVGDAPGRSGPCRGILAGLDTQARRTLAQFLGVLTGGQP
ncbi:hypothetical protein [Streptomyces sp. NPDC101149]|uniref:hypothetical protein n=1 Tax=Streptomyces sp. NPDC101149 TaxID=3366113 RepID=UPI0038025523